MARPVTLGMMNVSMKFVSMEERRRDILRMADDAGRSGCQIVMIPEFADHHRTHEAFAAYKKGGGEYPKVAGLKLDSPFIRELSDLARKHRMVAIPNVLLNDNGTMVNSAVVIGPEGDVLGQYRKSHIAPGECDHFQAGNEIKPIATPYGNWGF
jgi:predicted amidohydrolase